MLKCFLWLAGLACLLTLPLPTANAAPITDLIHLAGNFPQSTGLYVAMRTDDNFINIADAIAAEINNRIFRVGAADIQPASFRRQPAPGDITPVRDYLNSVSNEFFGDDFDTAMRPWLGDSLAVGITDYNVVFEVATFNNIDEVIADGDFPFIVAFEIADRDEAEAALDAAITDATPGDLRVRAQSGEYVYYQPDETRLALLLTPSAFVMGNPADLLDAIDMPQPSLLADAAFNETLARLPEDTYNFIAFADYAALIEGSVAAAAFDPSIAPEQQAADAAYLNPFLAAVDGLALGGTILNERTLTIDFVQNADNTNLEAEGLQVAVPVRIAPAFADHIPADMAFVLLSSDFARLYDATVENIRAIARLQAEADIAPDFRINEADVEGALFLAQLGLRRYSGLDLEDDILSWMDSDFALVLGINSEVSRVRDYNDLSVAPVEFGLIFDDSNDAEAAARTTDGIDAAVAQLLVEFEQDLAFSDVSIERTTETLAGTDVRVYTITDESGFNFQFPFEVIVGANDDVFVIGSRTVVEVALTGDGGLRDTQAFQEVEEIYLVEEAGILMLANPEAMYPFADLWSIAADPFFNPQAAEEAQTIRNVLALFSSATISGSNAENGSTVTRMTLSLNIGSLDQGQFGR